METSFHWFVMEVCVANCEFFLLDTVVQGKCTIQAVHISQTSLCSEWTSESGSWKVWTKVTPTSFCCVVSSFYDSHRGAGGFEAAANKEEGDRFLDEREKLIAFWDTLKRPVFVMTVTFIKFCLITDRSGILFWTHNLGDHVPSLDKIIDQRLYL